MQKQHSENIILYLNGQMSVEEALLFEKEIMADPALHAAVSEARAIKEFITDKKLNELKSTIKGDLKKIRKQDKIKNNLWKGGSLLLILVAGMFLVLNSTQKNIPKANLVVTDTAKETRQPVKAEIETFSPEKTDTATQQKEAQAKTFEKTQKEVKLRPIEPEKDQASIAGQDTIKPKSEAKAIKTANIDTNSITLNSKIVSADTNPELPATKTCDSVILDIEYNVENACNGKDDGSITVTSVSGGKNPYLLSLDSKKGYTSQKEFSGLTPGLYTIYLKDKNSCSGSENILVGVKSCSTRNEYSFNPGYGEKWEPELKESANIKVLDRAGKVVFETSTDLDVSWTGTDLSGNLVQQGVYIYLINYKSGEHEQGYISVIR